ncbi:uncharacterized protein VTP21DRAFT_4971 [Calcarisporiella thermophila]|uniref:uncharacterized protein n=1 Tax=Calcarisporiella thermophila TaxID=911321 RepID=UPI0037439AAE
MGNLNSTTGVPKYLMPAKPSLQLKNKILRRLTIHSKDSQRAQAQPQEGMPQDANLAMNSSASTNYDYDEMPCNESKFGNYVWLKGRRFHNSKNARYILPNDAEELRRLVFQHYLIKMAFEGIYYPPVKETLMNGGRVLDVGCGPGSWVMEMAQEFPKAEIVGLDLCPTFPDSDEFEHKNVKFILCNVLDGVPFPDAHFDFVHQRMFLFGYTEQQWREVMQELVRITKPGGWIQLLEQGMRSHRMGPENKSFYRKTSHAIRARGMEPLIAENLSEVLAEAGLTNIMSTFASVPVGSWGGELGTLWQENFIALNKSCRPWMNMVFGLRGREYRQLIQKLVAEFDLYKTYINLYVAAGQRPTVEQLQADRAGEATRCPTTNPHLQQLPSEYPAAPDITVTKGSEEQASADALAYRLGRLGSSRVADPLPEPNTTVNITVSDEAQSHHVSTGSDHSL